MGHDRHHVVLVTDTIAKATVSIEATTIAMITIVSHMFAKTMIAMADVARAMTIPKAKVRKVAGQTDHATNGVTVGEMDNRPLRLDRAAKGKKIEAIDQSRKRNGVFT